MLKPVIKSTESIFLTIGNTGDNLKVHAEHDMMRVKIMSTDGTHVTLMFTVRGRGVFLIDVVPCQFCSFVNVG
jgi:hypothetical protein